MSVIDRIRFNSLEDCKLCCSNLFGVAEETQVCENEGCELIQDCVDITPPNGAPNDFRDLCEIGRDLRYMGFSSKFSVNNLANVCNEGGQVIQLPLPNNPVPPFIVNSSVCASCCNDLDSKFDLGSDDIMGRLRCSETCTSESYCLDLNQHDNRMGCSVAIDFLTLGIVDFSGNLLACNSAGVVTIIEPTLQPSRNPSSAPTQNPSEKPTNTPSETPTLQPFHSPSGNPISVNTQRPTIKLSAVPTLNPTIFSASNQPSFSFSSEAPTDISEGTSTDLMLIIFGVFIGLIVFAGISAAFDRHIKKRLDDIRHSKAGLTDASSAVRYRFSVSTLGNGFSRRKKTNKIRATTSSLPSGGSRTNLKSNRIQIYQGAVFENDDGELTQISF